MTAVCVAIVGLGRIGATNRDVGEVPRSHLSAVRATRGLRLSALIDHDAQALARVPDTLAGEDVLRALSVAALPHGEIDILIDATDQQDRAALLRTAGERGARLAILEKPVAPNVRDGLALRKVVADTGMIVRVNFHRRFDGRHRALRPEAAPHLVQAVYGGGLLNNGSHLVDLLLDWMGPVAAVRAMPPSADQSDDPSIGFELRFESGAAGRVDALTGIGWNVFEARFFGPFGRIDLTNGGADLSRAEPVESLIYPGYTHLRSVPTGGTAPVSGLTHLYAAARDAIAKGLSMAGATIEDAIAGLAVIDAVKRSAAEGAAWLSVSVPKPVEV